jgi:ankyrin repeat protein
LDNLPKTLDETYERTLQGIDEEKWDYAHRLFQCLVVSVRPLHVEELAEVLAVLPNDENIPRFDPGWRPENAKEAVFSACSTLITVVNIDGEEVVQFSHFSVKEFLTSSRIATSESVSHFHVILRSAHRFLASASLSVLLELGGRINKRNVKDFPLASYAARHWVDHAQFEDVLSLIQDEMEFLFDKDRPHFVTWVWLHDQDRHSLQSHMSGTHPEKPDAGPLYYAALCGFSVMAERLLTTHRHDVNARGGQCVTPLHASVKKGHLKATQTLLKNGAKLDARDDEGSTPLHKASQHGDPEVVRSLLQGGANPNVENENNETPLYLASRKGWLEAVRLLLEYGADPNHQDEWGWSALRTAAANGQEDVAELLLRYRADTGSRDADSNTPLHMASFNGRVGAVRVLLEYGSFVDVRDRRGGTPLQDAAQDGFLEVVQLLLDNRADPNAQKEDHWQALHCAAGNGHLEVVELLLKHRGDLHARNGEGETPLQVALRENHPQVVQLLKEWGAEECKM